MWFVGQDENEIRSWMLIFWAFFDEPARWPRRGTILVEFDFDLLTSRKNRAPTQYMYPYLSTGRRKSTKKIYASAGAAARSSTHIDAKNTNQQPFNTQPTRQKDSKSKIQPRPPHFYLFFGCRHVCKYVRTSLEKFDKPGMCFFFTARHPLCPFVL